MTSTPGSRIPRLVMWLLVAVAGAWLVITLRTAQAGDDSGLASGLMWSGGCLVLAGMLGLRTAQERRRTQATAAAHAAHMMLIAQLGQQDDATLERMARSPGTAGDAARTILQGRHLGNPAGSPRHNNPESA